MTYQRQLPLRERGQRERSSLRAARGTGQARGGHHGPNTGTALQTVITPGTHTQAGGAAGAEVLGGLGVAAVHGVWVLHHTRRVVSGARQAATRAPA